MEPSMLFGVIVLTAFALEDKISGLSMGGLSVKFNKGA